MGKIKSIVNELRPRHYIKNMLIFIPIIFNGELFSRRLLINTVAGTCSFCAISSIVYIINDLCDYDNDCKNELKRKRPIANNEITKKEAQIIIAILFAAFLLFVQQIHTISLVNIYLIRYMIPVIYLAINIGYSLGFKNVPVMDVAIVASGFILRVFYGGMVTDISISSWVYLTIITGAVYLSLGKRLSELRWDTCGKRKCLVEHPLVQESRGDLKMGLGLGGGGGTYSGSFLENNMYMCLALSLIFYSLSCMDVNTKVSRMGRNLLWTVPFVLFICLKYNLALEGSKDGDPTNIIFGDKHLF